MMEPAFNQSTAAPKYDENEYNNTPSENILQQLESKVYSCSKIRVILASILIFILLIIFFVLFSLLAVTGVTGIFSRPVVIGTIVFSLIVSAILTTLYVQYTIIKRVEISLKGVTIYYNSRKYYHYPLDTPFYSHVLVKTSYGMVSGITKTLNIPLSNGKKKEMSFKFFRSKDTLAEILEDVNNLRRYGKFDNRDNSVTPEVNVPNALQARFTVPKQRITDAEKRSSMMSPAYIVIITIVGTVVVPFLLYFLRMIPWNWIPWVMLFFLIFCPAVCIYITMNKKKVIGSCPENIALYTDHIQVDNDVFQINNIKKITMTPPSYSLSGYKSRYHYDYQIINYRCMTIFTHNGEKKYTLGQLPSAQSDLVFADYQMVYDSVKHWCFDHNISYHNNLE